MTNGCIFMGLGWLALASVAFAQDEEPEVTDGELEPVVQGDRRMSGTPEIRVVSFIDRPSEQSGDCPAAYARVGQCVEWVDFMPIAQMVEDGRAGGPVLHDAFRNSSELYARIMEDVSYRWNSSEAVEADFEPYGVWRIPPVGDHWEGLGAGPGERLYGLPHSSYWVDGAQFLPRVQPSAAESGDSIYRYIRFNHEPGIPEPEPYAILSGRFADRLIFDEEPRKLDLLDADPTSSSPFFDQLYPYKTARFFGAGDLGFGQDERSVSIPLSDFEVPPELRTVPRLGQYLGPGVGTDEERMLTEAETRALEERITRTRVRRAAFADLLFTEQETPEQARDIAAYEYESFYRDVGAQVVKFGRENYTPTHLRVLATLFAMQSPPGWNESFVSSVQDEMDDAEALFESEVEDVDDGPADSEDPLAAPYDADDEYYYYDDEPAESAVDSESLYDDLGSEAGSNTHINYSALPAKLVAAHLDYLSEDRGLQPMDQEFADFMHSEYRRPADQRALLKDRARAMPPEEGETLVQWITRYAVRYAKGANERAVEEGMNRLALEHIIAEQAAVDVAQSDLMETALLLDHVRYATVGRFVPDAPPDSWTTPLDQEALAEEEWIEVLAAHDYFPMPLDEPDEDAARNAWYDPLSVCTTERDFRAASEEMVFGAVNLDLLLVSDDGQDVQDPYAALWEARDRVPFLWVDDPRESSQPPVMTRMVGLPDGKAIYRVRWRVWTGWHLFWGVEDVGGVQWKGQVPEEAASGQLVWMRRHYDWLREWAGTPVVAEDAQRVALRTGAVCSDLALVDPAIVPTLVRAALLDGNFRPTAPYDKGADSAQMRGEDLGMGVRLVGNRNVDARTTTGDAAEAGVSVANENELEAVEGILPPANPAENIADIRAWVLPEIGQLSDDPLSDPTMLVVFDTYLSDDRAKTREIQPRVPYFRRDRKAQGDHVITAGWALAIPPGEVARPEMLSPDWVDTNSVNAENLNPRWRQRRTLHFTMAADLAFRPHHLARSRCSENQGVLNPSTGPCGLPGVDPKDAYEDTLASGIGAQYTLLQTLWLGSNRRMAVEYGLSGSLFNLFKPINLGNRAANQSSIVTSKWRFSGGPVVGLRGGGNPRRLFRRNGRGALWGAKDRDESVRQARTEYGIRLGAQFGGLQTGLFAEINGDAWWARSVTPGRAKNRMFTAYHPSFLIGPFIAGRYARDVATGADGTPRSFGHSQSFDVGIRIQARVFNYGGADPTAGIR